MRLPIDIGTPNGAITVAPLDDSAQLFRALDAAAVWVHIPGERPVSSEALAARLTVANRQVLTIRHRGTIAGTSSYIHDPSDPAGIEIGATVLAPEVWGTGVNSAAKRIMIDAAFASGAAWLQFRTDERNHRSAAAILKLPGATELAPHTETHVVRADGTARTSRMFRIARP